MISVGSDIHENSPLIDTDSKITHALKGRERVEITEIKDRVDISILQDDYIRTFYTFVEEEITRDVNCPDAIPLFCLNRNTIPRMVELNSRGCSLDFDDSSSQIKIKEFSSLVCIEYNENSCKLPVTARKNDCRSNLDCVPRLLLLSKKKHVNSLIMR